MREEETMVSENGPGDMYELADSCRACAVPFQNEDHTAELSTEVELESKAESICGI
jgi:hypothetical protein